MKEIFDFILRIIVATLLICLINTILHFEIPYHWLYLCIIALFGIKGVIVVLAMIYFL